MKRIMTRGKTMSKEWIKEETKIEDVAQYRRSMTVNVIRKLQCETKP